MNVYAIAAIYRSEMMRFFRTLGQSLVSPVISTSLFFIVFGTAIGSRIENIEGISYGSFIVPGMLMMTLLTQSVSNASFGIFFYKFTGSIYELLSSPISALEIVLGFVGAATTKSAVIGLVILGTATFFVDIQIEHPLLMIFFFLLTCFSFSLFGFVIGIWADNFEKLQILPLLVITPLVFLGGSFYSVNMLPPFWQGISKLNPIFYLISGFRRSFFGVSEVDMFLSLAIIQLFILICIGIVCWIFRTGYAIKP